MFFVIVYHKNNIIITLQLSLFFLHYNTFSHKIVIIGILKIK